MIGISNLLGLIFLLWLPILIGIYFFKSRPIRYKISSLYLWRKVHQKRRNRGFLEKFKNNIIFWLQLVFFFLLFIALSKPYIKDQQQNEKQIYIIDNSGSMVARSGLFNTRLSSSLQLVRKHAKARKNNNIEVYKWNSRLQKINLGDNLEVKLSRIKPSHLPNSDFVYLVEQIKDFINKGYKVSLFTDSLAYEEQLNLSKLGVEFFLSAQNNRNIYFESIDGKFLNDGRIKFTVKVSCTSAGGSGILLVSQKGLLSQRLPFKLKEYDNRQFELEIEPVSFSEPIRFELLPDKPDLLVEDNLLEYFIDSRIPRIAISGFSDSALFSKLFHDFLTSDKRFRLDNKEFQIRFINVTSLPSKPQALTVYVIEGDSRLEDSKESKSHILESGHPLVRFIGGHNFSAANNLEFDSEIDGWDSIIQIKQRFTKQSTPGLLIHKSFPACILLNLEFTSHSIANVDYPILLENILRYILQELQMKSIFEIGSGVIENNTSVLLKSDQSVNPIGLEKITLQGVYKSPDGSNYFARFPVIESRLKDADRASLIATANASRLARTESSVNTNSDNSKLTRWLIFLAIIFMIYEWYLFSRRA